MSEVEEIKQRLEVADVVGGYIQLKQSGRNLKGLCPFHHEKTPSFMVSPEKGIWHCFGCGEGGDIFKFVMQMEGMEFRDALELLARRAGVELKERGKDPRARDKKRLYEATELAVRYYQASLLKNPSAINYVVKTRKLGRQTIQEFGIGYAPESWQALTGFLQKKGFKSQELLQAGLAGQKPGRQNVYDLFRGRVMLTIHDAQGRPIGFTGRVLDDSLPKYLNSPQTPIFDKSRVMYGLHLAKEAIRKSDEVVLVEGNMDVIASHQAGLRQVVATSGTALTIDQMKALSKFTKVIKLAFDADSAGLAATAKALPLVQKLGLKLHVVDLAGAKDPDELIQKDPKLWEKAVKDAKYVVDFWLDKSAKDFDLGSPLGKRQLVERMAMVLKGFDQAHNDPYIKELSKQSDTGTEAIKEKIEASPSSIPHAAKAQEYIRVREAAKVPAEPRPGKSMIEKLEEAILAMCLTYPDTRPSLSELTRESFSGPERQEIFAALTSDNAKNTAASLSKQDDYVKILTLQGEHQFEELSPPDRSFEAFNLVKRLQTQVNRKLKSELKDKLREAEQAGDTAQRRVLLEQYQRLIKEEI